MFIYVHKSILIATYVLFVAIDSCANGYLINDRTLVDNLTVLLDVRSFDLNRTKSISSDCRSDMSGFFAALHNRSTWALQRLSFVMIASRGIPVLDSNGRYSSNWFMGNEYWTGSKYQCGHINKLMVTLGENVTVNVPETNFAVIKLKIQTSNYPVRNLTKTIYWGVCLPKTCSQSDIASLVYRIQKLASGSGGNGRFTIRIERIKNYLYYRFIDDPVFYYASTIFAIVFVLSVIGTYYEHRIMNVNKSAIVNVTENGRKIQLYAIENRTIWLKIILSFSLRSNLKSILQLDIGSDTIAVLHGLRLFSMCWIIVSHTCLVTSKYSDNPKFQQLVKDELITKTILNGAYNVDTFFFISGLLVTLLYLRSEKRGRIASVYQSANVLLDNAFRFFGLLGYRFVRLSAPYMYIIFVQILAAKWFAFNSIFEPPYYDHVTCPNYWWRNILYINTLFPVDQMCMIWSWYLANDTQFFIIGAVLLVVYKSRPKLAAVMFFACLFLSWAVTGYVSYINGFVPRYENALSLFDELYDKPYTRLGPYFMGMLAGWIFYKSDCRLTFSKITVVFGWLITVLVLYTLLYVLDDMPKSAVSGAIYSCLSHSIWAVCILWITLACTAGHGGPLNRLLSMELIRPLSRLTYCAYLVHPIVIRCTVMTLDAPLSLNRVLIGILSFGQLTVSFAFALVLSLLFEAPAVAMIRTFSTAHRTTERM